MKNILVFIFMFFSYAIVFSQNERQIDSLLVVLKENESHISQINTLNKICIEYNVNNNLKHKQYNQQILTLSRKHNYKIGFGLYYLNCSLLNLSDNDGKKALKFSRKAAAIFLKNHDIGNYLVAIKEMSKDYIELNTSQKSKSILNHNLKLALNHKNNEILVDFYRLLGDCLGYQDSIAKSIIHYKKAIPYLSKEKSISKSHFFQRVSDQYTKLEQNNKALVYIDLSIENREKNYQFLAEAKKALILNKLSRHNEALGISLENYQSIIAYKMTSKWQYNLILYNIANAYYNLKKYNLAIQNINKVIDIKNTNPEYKIECFVILSTIYYNLNKKKEARFFSNKALVFHDSLYAKFGNFELFSNVSKIEEDAGNYKKALKFYQNQVNYSVERNAQINNENNLLLQTDFDVTVKDYNIKTLKEQKKIKTIENKKQKDLIIFIGVLLLIALLGVLFYVKTNKTIKIKNKVIENEKLHTQKSLVEKEILLKEIHHRVKNNMQTVISLLKIQSLDTKQLTIDDFVSISEARINAMILVHENLYQNEALDKICFEEYLNNLKLSIVNSQQTDKNIELEVIVNKICLDIQTAIPVGLIVNELVNNAYKHAFVKKTSGIIRIALNQDNNKYLLTVSDNGVGINKPIINQKGLGLELVGLLVSQIKGVLTIDNSEGTCFTIQF